MENEPVDNVGVTGWHPDGTFRRGDRVQTYSTNGRWLLFDALATPSNIKKALEIKAKHKELNPTCK